MKTNAYYRDGDIDGLVFPDVAMRRIGHIVRNVKVIPDYRAVVDRNTDRTFSIVKTGYNLIPHQQVIEQMDNLCAKFPEYGTPTREIWLESWGGRMKTKWTFSEVDFEIKPGDIVHPTLETLCSYDTTLAQSVVVGGMRLVCTNGMMIGKVLAKYKRKHTAGLDMERAAAVLSGGMKGYSAAVGLWQKFLERDAFLNEINCFEVLPFHAEEKASITREIKTQGNVLTWSDEVDERNVRINAWDMMNILTAEATHRVPDAMRGHKILEEIAEVFS